MNFSALWSGYIDLQKNELRNAVIQNLGSAPSSPVAGQTYYDTGASQLKWYNGSTWVVASGASFGSVSSLTVGAASVDGVATTAARSDHTHGLPGWGSVTAQTSFGGSSANGVATTFARSDHTHGTPAAPTASSVGAIANGGGLPTASLDTFANRPAFGTSGRVFVDSTNNLLYRDTGAAWQQLMSFATPGNSAVGDAAAAGSAVTYARSDHTHGRESFGSVTAQTSYGASSSNGAATTPARSDHTHGTPSLTSNAASTQAIGDSATVGTGTAPARDDHKHAMPAFAAPSGVLSFGGSNAAGAATTLVRSDHVHALPAHDGSAHSAVSISNLAAATGTYSFGANLVQSSATPSGANDLTNKAYVDSVATGLDFKQSVRMASTANVSGTYSATGGSSARGQLTAMSNAAIDGVSLTAGNRVLLKNQSTPAQNGIWVITTVGTGSNGVWDRATDFDQDAEVTSGAFVFVEEGTVNGDTGWVLTTNNPITIGGASGTSLTWAQFSGAGTYTNGNGLSLTGTSFAVVADTGIAVSGSGVAVNHAGSNGTHVPLMYTTATHSSSTTIAITHNLGFQWVCAHVFDASTGEEIECGITCTSSTVTTFYFASAPSANSLRFLIHG